MLREKLRGFCISYFAAFSDNPCQKWLGHLSCITYPPSPLINVGKYRVFSNKKGKNHLIIDIENGGRGELALCPNSFVRVCLKEQFKECSHHSL